MTPTNPECINSGKLGYECDALVKVQYGCLQGVCPFFKTIEQFEEDEAREKQICLSRGYHFKSREQVIEDMARTTEIQKKRYQKDKKKAKPEPKVLQYNTKENSYIEYDSIGNAVNELMIPRSKLELLIKRGEEYQGYKFILV